MQQLKNFSVYKLTSPSGRAYVGYTGQGLAARWGQHVRRSRLNVKHPLSAAIRKHGPENFTVELLFETQDYESAIKKEAECIAVLLKGYNISPGGSCDSAAGHAAFKLKMQDADFKAAYIAKLKQSLKTSLTHAAHGAAFASRVAEWRKHNPREAYYASMRALRLARQSRKPRTPQNSRSSAARGAAASALRAFWTLEHRALRKRKSIKARKAAAKTWALRSSSEKAKLGAKISEGLRVFNQNADEAVLQERREQLANARKNIDHEVRKARQSQALQAYWTPERRKAYGLKVKARVAARILKNANV